MFVVVAVGAVVVRRVVLVFVLFVVCVSVVVLVGVVFVVDMLCDCCFFCV